MPNSLQSALVNPLDPSSCEACRLGPNALMPAWARSSTMPAASGVSGPTTTRSTALVRQNPITAAWSAISSATHSASRAIPALPGAHQSFITSGDAAIFHARACSRPPEPSRRMCMRKPVRFCGTESVARISLLLQGEIRLLSFRPGSRSRDDLLQHRHMAGEGAAPRGGGNHCGLRFLADKCLFDRDVAGPCQRFDMSAEIAIGGAGQLLQPREFQPRSRRRQRVQRGHDLQPERLMDDLVQLSHRAQLRRIPSPPSMSSSHETLLDIITDYSA